MILQAFVRGAVVIVIAGLLATLLRNRSAALRHHVWATAIVVQLCLLAFIPTLPAIRVPIIPVLRVQVDAPVPPAGTSAPAEPAARESAEQMPGSTLSPHISTTAAPPDGDNGRATRTFADYLLIAWMIGAGLILARFLLGTVLMLRLALRGKRVEDGEWLVLAQRIACELGITRPVTMIWGDNVAVPITWGVLYPMILLPRSAQEWPLERRRFVLVHEMAHVKRFDALTQFLAQITAAIFWFSPFVWLAEWRMRVEREHACDDTVIQHGTEPSVYANELLQMVRTLVRRRAPQPAFAALAMARKSEFEGRMLAILDPERQRRVTGITSGIVFALLSVLIAAPLAAVDPFAFKEATTAQPAVARAPDCDFENGDTGTTANVTGGPPESVVIRLQRKARCVFGDIAGPVQLSPDERRILAVNEGGFVWLREVVPERAVELTIENSSKGGVKRSFTINNRVPDHDGRTEREWVARVLPELLLEGAVNPQERVQTMLRSNGLNATLAQISAVVSAPSRHAHFRALLAAREWTDAELGRIRTAARE